MRAVVIPCSGSKLDRPARARELYTGPLFRSALMAGDALVQAGQAERVLVLSALHGLVELERWLEPYDVTMGDPDQVPVWELARQLDSFELLTVLPLLPTRYDHVLSLAVSLAAVSRRTGWSAGFPLAGMDELEPITLEPNPLEGAAGIGDQRGRLRQLRELAA